MPNSKVIFQPNTADCLQQGVNQMLNAIIPTLGPFPRMVAFDNTAKGLELLDDGGTIARRIIQIPNRDADMGAMYVRQMLWQVRENLGDGTATAAVLFKAIFNEGLRLIAAGGNAMRLRHYLEQGAKIIQAELDKQKFQVEGKENLAGLAETTCHDPELAKMLGEIFDIIGEHGHLEVRFGRSRKLEREYFEGMYWKGGLTSPFMLTQIGKSKINLENTAVFITDLALEDKNDLQHLLQVAIESGAKQLLLLVQSIKDDLLGLLSTDAVKEKIQVVPVKLGVYDGPKIVAALEDLAILTGGRPVVRAAGQTAQSVTVADLGHARRAWADLKYFGLSGGKGDPRKLRQHIYECRAAYESSTNENTRELLQTRIGKLMGGSALLWVGGATEIEIKTRKEIAERSARVLRGAVTGGVLPGGGTAVLACQTALEEKAAASTIFEEKAAYQILAKAMEAPINTLIRNGGDKPEKYLGQIKQGAAGTVFDMRSKQVVDAIAAGVLDVADVQKGAVERAIRAASLALTVDVLVHVKNPAHSTEP
ncbi:MAG: hypothetical protein DWQ04_06265 [Chloroflexi bacterium]|nr:MAG: hypothetical protein DWQ04_06265 [Chloroflexota bacterium]